MEQRALGRGKATRCSGGRPRCGFLRSLPGELGSWPGWCHGGGVEKAGLRSQAAAQGCAEGARQQRKREGLVVSIGLGRADPEF